MIARGRYVEAEVLLQPVAVRAQTSEAALQLGLLQKMLGRPGAGQTLERVTGLVATTRSASEIVRAGRALQALDRFKEANDAFRIAAGAAPRNADVQTGWGDLFLEKYNNTEAIKSYQAAFEADPRWAPALLGAARALEGDDDPPQAAAMIKRVLQINPSSVDAQTFLAGQAADVDHRREARAALKKALEINPSSIDAHISLAALAFVEDNNSEFEAEVEKVHAVAPAQRRRVSRRPASCSRTAIDSTKRSR